MLAISALSPDLTAILLLVAFVAFVVAAILSLPLRSASFWISIGLALWVFVSMWDALAAT